MDVKHIIEPENLGLWTAVTFVLALLALVVGIVAIQRGNELALVTQTQLLMLNKKVEVSKAAAAPAAPAQAETAAPAAK